MQPESRGAEALGVEMGLAGWDSSPPIPPFGAPSPMEPKHCGSAGEGHDCQALGSGSTPAGSTEAPEGDPCRDEGKHEQVSPPSDTAPLGAAHDVPTAATLRRSAPLHDSEAAWSRGQNAVGEAGRAGASTSPPLDVGRAGGPW